MLSTFTKTFVRFNSTIVKPLVTPSIVDLRIGRIVDIKRHENADKLYVSQIQIEQDKLQQEQSEEEDTTTTTTTTTTTGVKTVQVCSGLVDFIPQSELLNSRVVLVMNLKASKMRGVKSEAMLLAASNEKPELPLNEVRVELVNPPESLPIGQSLFFKGYKPVSTEFKKLKPKHFVEVAQYLKTDENGKVIFTGGGENEVSYLGSQVNDDICSVRTLKNCQVR